MWLWLPVLGLVAVGIAAAFALKGNDSEVATKTPAASVVSAPMDAVPEVAIAMLVAVATPDAGVAYASLTSNSQPSADEVNLDGPRLGTST